MAHHFAPNAGYPSRVQKRRPGKIKMGAPGMRKRSEYAVILLDYPDECCCSGSDFGRITKEFISIPPRSCRDREGKMARKTRAKPVIPVPKRPPDSFTRSELLKAIRKVWPS